MGTKGREIVELDVKELIELLNKTYADDWLAYHQYWVSAQIVKGENEERSGFRTHRTCGR
jgi:bacterioferritin